MIHITEGTIISPRKNDKLEADSKRYEFLKKKLQSFSVGEEEGVEDTTFIYMEPNEICVNGNFDNLDEALDKAIENDYN